MCYAVVVTLTALIIWSVCARRALAIEATDEETAASVTWVADRFGSDPTRLPLSFVYGGRASADVMSSWHTELAQERLDDNRAQRTVTVTDPDTGLRVRMEGVLFDDFPAVEWVLHLENNGSADTPILEQILPLDTRELLSGDGDRDPILHYSKGALCSIDDFAPVDTVLANDVDVRLHPGGGRSSSEVLPFFNLDQGSGGIVLGIGWTGEWAATFGRDPDGRVRLQAGMAETHLTLHPGEALRTPRILMLFWKDDRLRGNNLLRQFLLTHHRPKPGGRALELPTVLGSWGGWPTSEHLVAIDRIIEHDLPIELLLDRRGMVRGPALVQIRRQLERKRGAASGRAPADRRQAPWRRSRVPVVVRAATRCHGHPVVRAPQSARLAPRARRRQSRLQPAQERVARASR